MRNEKYAYITERLGEILVEERQCLRSMEVEKLVERSTEKLSLVKELEALLAVQSEDDLSAGSRTALTRVAQLAQGNDQHFNAVRMGLSNAISRLSRQGTESDAGAYNQYGEQVRFRDATGGYLKKA